MLNKNKKNKRSNNISTRPSKKNNNDSSSNKQEESQELQWVDLEANKTSWVWKNFGIKTDEHAYCRYKVLKIGIEEEYSHSFNSANGKGFLRMINKFDPAFQPPCYVTIKRDIGFGYQVVFQAIKKIIIQTCDTAAITTDLWTFRAKSEYIGITCHWLTEKMELYDVLIYVEQINYPHT
ncbi:9420_t:CDS:2, partial [Funneliformis geosporum]